MNLEIEYERREQENYYLKLKTIISLKEKDVEFSEDELLSKGVAFYDNLKEMFGDVDRLLTLSYSDYKKQYDRCLIQLANMEMN